MDPKVSKRHRTSSKKPFGFGHKTTRKFHRPTRKWQNCLGLMHKNIFGSGLTDPKISKPHRTCCKKKTIHGCPRAQSDETDKMQTAQGFLSRNRAPMPCGARSRGELFTPENICFAGSLKRFAIFRFCWAWPDRVGVPAGGAAALPLPWDLHCCALPALQPRCIRAPPCFAKRNKLSERRWAFERHDLGGHAFLWRVRRHARLGWIF